jgi:hypothetical protein
MHPRAWGCEDPFGRARGRVPGGGAYAGGPYGGGVGIQGPDPIENVRQVTKNSHLTYVSSHRRGVCYSCNVATLLLRVIPHWRKKDMRGTLLLVSMTLALLLASGVALAEYGGGGGIEYNTVRCDGGKCEGTTNDDRMVGTDRRDILYAFKGSDLLFGNGGSDDLYGFLGYDQLRGGDGSDKLGGGEDRDDLYGNSGPDVLNGGDHADQMIGGDGNDKVFGGGGVPQEVISRISMAVEARTCSPAGPALSTTTLTPVGGTTRYPTRTPTPSFSMGARRTCLSH